MCFTSTFIRRKRNGIINYTFVKFLQNISLFFNLKCMKCNDNTFPMELLVTLSLFFLLLQLHLLLQPTCTSVIYLLFITHLFSFPLFSRQVHIICCWWVISVPVPDWGCWIMSFMHLQRMVRHMQKSSSAAYSLGASLYKPID